jgi:WD40 repeat protein
LGLLVLISRVNGPQPSAVPVSPVPSYGLPSSGSGVDTTIDSDSGPLAFSPDGKVLAVADVETDQGTTGFIALFDLDALARIAVLPDIKAPNSLAFSPNGRQLAVGSADGTVGLWTIATRKKTATATLRPVGSVIDNIHDLAFSKDGKTLFTCDDNGQYGQWAIGPAKPVIMAIPGKDRPSCDALSPDGRTFATDGVKSGALALWRKTGRRLKPMIFDDSWTKRGGDAQSMAFSRDGTTFAALREGSTGRGAVEVWDLASRKRIATREVTATDSSTLTFGADNKTLAITTGDSVAELWKFRDGSAMTIPSGESGTLQAVGFSPDGRHFATAGVDGRIRYWDLKTLNQVTTWPAAG